MIMKKQNPDLANKIPRRRVMTPYGAAKIVNSILVENEIKTIPPQMVYNYAKKGYIVSSTVEGKIDIDEKDLMTWLIKYLAKKGIEIVQVENNEVEGQEVLSQ